MNAACRASVSWKWICPSICWGRSPVYHNAGGLLYTMIAELTGLVRKWEIIIILYFLVQFLVSMVKTADGSFDSSFFLHRCYTGNVVHVSESPSCCVNWTCEDAPPRYLTPNTRQLRTTNLLATSCRFSSHELSCWSQAVRWLIQTPWAVVHIEVLTFFSANQIVIHIRTDSKFLFVMRDVLYENYLICREKSKNFYMEGSSRGLYEPPDCLRSTAQLLWRKATRRR